MKKRIIALSLLLPLMYAPALFAGARGGDTAWAVLHGEPDRLHQPWPGDTQPSRYGTEDPQKAREKTPEQEMQPQRSRQEPQPSGETEK